MDLFRLNTKSVHFENIFAYYFLTENTKYKEVLDEFQRCSISNFLNQISLSLQGRFCSKKWQTEFCCRGLTLLRLVVMERTLQFCGWRKKISKPPSCPVTWPWVMHVLQTQQSIRRGRFRPSALRNTIRVVHIPSARVTSEISYVLLRPPRVRSPEFHRFCGTAASRSRTCPVLSACLSVPPL